MTNKDRFIQINRDMFQNEEILHKIKSETRTNQIDIIFGVYTLFEFDKNRFLTSSTTLKDIESYLYESKQTKNINYIREAIEILEAYEIIDYDFDVYAIKSNEIFRVKVLEYKQFMQVSESDFKLLDKLGSKFFLLYCNINNYYSKEYGYSFAGFDKMSKLLSKSTIAKYLNIAYSLNIYDIKTDGWIYKEDLNKAIRSNNMYILNEDRINEIADMSKSDINELLNVDLNVVREDRFKAEVYSYLDERDLSYERSDSDKILENLNEDKRKEILSNINNVSEEFEYALIVYYAEKLISKETRETLDIVYAETDEDIVEENETIEMSIEIKEDIAENIIEESVHDENIDEIEFEQVLLDEIVIENEDENLSLIDQINSFVMFNNNFTNEDCLSYLENTYEQNEINRLADSYKIDCTLNNNKDIMRNIKRESFMNKFIYM